MQSWVQPRIDFTGVVQLGGVDSRLRIVWVVKFGCSDLILEQWVGFIDVARYGLFANPHTRYMDFGCVFAAPVLIREFLHRMGFYGLDVQMSC